MLAVFSDASVSNDLRKALSLAFVVVQDGKIIYKGKKTYYGDITSSDAEYEALISAMRWVLKNTQPQKVTFFTDFEGITYSVYCDKEDVKKQTWVIRALLEDLQSAGFEPYIQWLSRDFNIAHATAFRGLKELLQA